MIEQLHFTWAETGLQGRGRFQVTAASPGLQDLSGDLARLALRLCRWSGGDRQDAVSFGWIDAREHRFVFRRVPTGRTPDGRPGGFAAHVLVAPAGLISVADVLQRPCRPGLWWAGEAETDRVLPRLRPQPVRAPAGAQADADSGQAADGGVTDAAAQILGQHAAGHIAADWRAVLDAAARCSTVLPEAFEELRSFSTFEHGESAAWFQLAGVEAPARPRIQPAGTARAAAQLILAPDSAGRRAARAAADATKRDSRVNWQAFTVLAAALQAIRSEQPFDCDALVPALRDPATGSEVLQLRRARQAIADALIAGSADVSAALTASAAGLNGDLLRQLGVDIGDRCQAAGEPGGGGRIATAVEPLGPDVLDGLAQVLLRETGVRWDDWPGSLIHACLRSPVLPEAAGAGLALAAARSDRLLPTLTDNRVPLRYRVQIAAAAITAGTLSASSFGRLAAADWELFTSVAPALAAAGRLEQVLDAMDSPAAQIAVTRIASSLPAPLRLSACQRVMARLSPLDGIEFAAWLRHMSWAQYADAWDTTVDGLLRAAVQAQLTDMQRFPEPGVLTRACSHRSLGTAWNGLLTALQRTQAEPAGANLQLVAASLRLLELRPDGEVHAYATQCVLPALRYGQVEEALLILSGQVDGSSLSPAITAAVRAASLRRPLPTASELIELALWCDDTGDRTLDRCGRLAAWLEGQEWELLERRLASAPGNVRRRMSRVRRRGAGNAAWLASRLRR